MDVLQIFGGLFVRGCYFDKVAKRLCCDCASAFLFSCELASCLRSIFLGESQEDCFWTEIILYRVFNLFFLMKYTFKDFKVSVLL